MKRVLFVCGRNRSRSPTAESVFGNYPDVETASAGTSPDADIPLSSELIEWADIVFVMEPGHRRKLSTQFRESLRNAMSRPRTFPTNTISWIRNWCVS